MVSYFYVGLKIVNDKIRRSDQSDFEGTNLQNTFC